MKRTKSWRWSEMALLIVILWLLILIITALASRIVPVPFGSELSPAKTGNSGTITADGFTTAFVFAENASLAVKDYQQHFLLNIGLLMGGSIGLLYGGMLLIYGLLFKLKPILGIYFALGGLGLIWVGLGGLNILNDPQAHVVSDCARLQNVYDSRQYRITEGIVHVSHVQPDSGHDRGDSIQVGNVVLEVDYYFSNCAYRQSIAHGGVLTEGTYARVHYSDDGAILRIDVKNQ